MGALDTCHMDDLDGDGRESCIRTRADARDDINIMRVCKTIKRKSREILVDRQTPSTNIQGSFGRA